MNNKLLKQPAVYIFTNKLNGKVYVGETMNLHDRIRKYRNVKPNRPFCSALLKYGLDGFHFEYYYLPDFTKKDLLDMEEQMIVRYKSLTTQNGYNICVRGRDHTGKIVSEQFRKKMSETTTGESNGMFGKKHNEETKKKISESKKIKPNNGMLGKPVSKEARKKMSDARKRYWLEKRLSNG